MEGWNGRIWRNNFSHACRCYIMSLWNLPKYFRKILSLLLIWLFSSLLMLLLLLPLLLGSKWSELLKIYILFPNYRNMNFAIMPRIPKTQFFQAYVKYIKTVNNCGFDRILKSTDSRNLKYIKCACIQVEVYAFLSQKNQKNYKIIKINCS